MDGSPPPSDQPAARNRAQGPPQTPQRGRGRGTTRHLRTPRSGRSQASGLGLGDSDLDHSEQGGLSSPIPLQLWRRQLGDEAPYQFDASRPAAPLRNELIDAIE